MNKKAFLGMSMVDLWSFLLIIIVLIGFTYMFIVSGILSGRSSRLLEQQANIDASSMLIGLLRHDVDGRSAAEFILENVNNKEKIAEKIKPLLDGVCKNENDCYWQLEILHQGKVDKIDGINGREDFYVNGKAEFFLPAKNEKIVIRLVRHSEMSKIRSKLLYG